MNFIKKLSQLTFVLFLCFSCHQQEHKNKSKNTTAINQNIEEVQDKFNINHPDIVIEENISKKETFTYNVVFSTDEFFKRGILYKSLNKNEKLIHVKVHVKNNKPSFYFIGAVRPENAFITQYGHLYELNENFEIYIVDSFPILTSFSEWISYENDDAFNDYVNRNFDNLILEDDKLYYYKEDDYTEWIKEPVTFRYNRTYFQYDIGSKQLAVEVNSDKFHYTSKMKLHSLERGVFSQDKKC
jgi:hypothetical protein